MQSILLSRLRSRGRTMRECECVAKLRSECDHKNRKNCVTLQMSVCRSVVVRTV